MVDRDGLLGQGTSLTQDYRNPSAHTMLMTREQFDACSRIVHGDKGMLWGLLRATASKKELERM